MNIETRLCKTSEMLSCVRSVYRFKTVILLLISYFTKCICNLNTHCVSVTLRKYSYLICILITECHVFCYYLRLLITLHVILFFKCCTVIIWCW